MPKLSSAAACGLVFTMMAAQVLAAAPERAGTCVDSPQAVLTVCVAADARGPWYEVYRGDRAVITHARLGLVLDGFGNEPASRVSNARRGAVDQSWEQPWGEQRVIHDRHAELRVTLSGADATRTEPFDLIVRVFDDGFGFRYEFNRIGVAREVAILDELTEFRLAGDWDAWWYPARHPDRDEYLYQRARLHEVHLAETPLTLQSPGLYLSIHEAALVDYASMNLRRTAERTLKADLMPWSDGVLVRKRGPFATPVAHGAGRRHADGARRLAHRAQPQRAEPPCRHLVDPHRQVRRHLVGDASQPFHLGQRRQTRREQCQREALHRLRGEERPRRRARRRLEQRLGWRLDRQRQTLQLHRVVSRLRSAAAGGVRA